MFWKIAYLKGIAPAMADQHQPTAAEALHPSEFIAAELEARRWSRIDLAVAMGGDIGKNLLVWDLYREVGPTDPRMRLGELTARQIADAFGVSSVLLVNLETAWRARHVH